LAFQNNAKKYAVKNNFFGVHSQLNLKYNVAYFQTLYKEISKSSFKICISVAVKKQIFLVKN